MCLKCAVTREMGHGDGHMGNGSPVGRADSAVHCNHLYTGCVAVEYGGSTIGLDKTHGL